MSFRLPPVTNVDVGRQDHQSVATPFLRSFRNSDCVGGAEGGDPRHDIGAISDGLNAGFENLILLRLRKSCSFAQRAEGNDPFASVIDQPLAVSGKEAVIYAEIRIEGGGDCGKDSPPVHFFHCGIGAASSGTASSMTRLRTLAGKM